jgi:thiamine kinase-like enzyme
LISTDPPSTDKKENQIFLIYKEIQNGALAKSYVRKGFLRYDEIRKYLATYEEAVSHI